MKTHRRTVRIAAAVVLVLAGTVSCAASAAEPAAAVATAENAVTHEQNDRVPDGAAWTQHYFPSTDGVELHADVLLPEGLAEGERVPVVLSAGSYFGHSGELTDENWSHTGPSDRFDDLIADGGLLERGYALVMVDTRGFGGSTGCLDFVGPGEQADIGAAIDWAATQPWSTGAVGMYGKSYDAITGLAGNNLDNDALRAVVAQEPVWDLHRNIWSNGVPRSTIANVSNEYNQIAMLPQLPDDDPRYLANAAYETQGAGLACPVMNTLGYQTNDPEGEYWSARDLAANAAGTDTPLLFTQGLLEWNTEAEAMQEFLDNHQGPERGWLGPWDHVRGNERLETTGRLEMGREGWFDEVFAHYDQYLKGIEPAVAYPDFAVQDSTGTWRAQDTWPVVEQAATLLVGGGSYVDDGADQEIATGVPEPGGNAVVTWSEPLTRPTRVTGTPRVTLNAQGHGNLLVTLLDVAPDGSAVAFDQQAAIVRQGGMSIELRSTDWVLPAGHHLAVEFGTIRPGAVADWLDTPSGETITITDARLDLALDDPADDDRVAGERAVWLDAYLATFARTLPVGTPTFTVPTITG